MARLRNLNTTDDGNIDFRSLKKILHSKLGKLMQSSGLISSKAVK